VRRIVKPSYLRLAARLLADAPVHVTLEDTLRLLEADAGRMGTSSARAILEAAVRLVPATA